MAPLVRTENVAEFGYAEPGDLTSTVLRLEGGEWVWQSSGGCRLYTNSISDPVLWHLATDAVTDPETTRVDVLVDERGCRGHLLTSQDRIRKPEVIYGAEEVIVTYTVDPLPPGTSGDCPGVPPTAAVLQLAKPLGNRTLLDGGIHPPRTPDFRRASLRRRTSAGPWVRLPHGCYIEVDRRLHSWWHWKSTGRHGLSYLTHRLAR